MKKKADKIELVEVSRTWAPDGIWLEKSPHSENHSVSGFWHVTYELRRNGDRLKTFKVFELAEPINIYDPYIIPAMTSIKVLSAIIEDLQFRCRKVGEIAQKDISAYRAALSHRVHNDWSNPDNITHAPGEVVKKTL